MKQTTRAAVAGMLLGAAALGSTGSLPKTGRYATSVSVEMKRALVNEVLAAVGKEAGIPLSLSSDLRERKVTVYVKKQPAWLVLERLASTIDAEWTGVSGGTPKLSTLLTARRLESDWARKYSQSRRQSVEKRLRGLAAKCRESYASLEQQRETVDKQLEAFWSEDKEDSPERDAELSRLREARSFLPERPAHYVLGRVLDRMGPSDWQRLFSGESVVSSTDLVTGWPPIEREGVDDEAQDSHAFVERERLLAFQFDPLRSVWSGSLSKIGVVGTQWTCTWERLTDLFDWIEDFDGGTDPRLAERDGQWSAQKDAGTLSTVLRSDRLPSDMRLKSLDDVAEAVWLASTMPVLVESQRQKLRQPGLPLPGGSLGQWLEGSLLDISAHIRLEQGWFLGRPLGWREWRAYEPPELPLRLVEQAKHPTLEDYARLAASLSDAQIRAFRFGRVAATDQALACKEAVPALRIWHNLPEDLRRKALVREPILRQDMSAAVRASFDQALLISTLDASSTLDQAPIALRDRYDPSSSSRLAFYIDQLETSTQTVKQGNVTITGEPDQLPSGSTPVSSQRTLEIRFLLGVDAQRCAVFPMSLRVPAQPDPKSSG